MGTSKTIARGFTLLEVLVAIGIFVLFAMGIYGTINLIFKIVYQSRMKILETALLAERLEIARNLPYDSVGIIDGVPSGFLPHTTTTVRNGQIFTIVTTVRNIDDPFDGTLGGTPNDTSPADYKLVEMSAICENCLQQRPVILSTRVAPKQLEGASQNGAIFIQVFDATGLPVVGADVFVTNTYRQPVVVVNDTTGNDGFLRVIDTTTGTLSYHIRVSKDGYSSDYTVVASVGVPVPVTTPRTVVSQTITDISFAIDRTGSLALHTISPTCVAIANAPFHIRIHKKIGVDPDIYKYDKSFVTDGSGNYNFTNFEWGKYYVEATGTSYTMAGSIPMTPVEVAPGLAQEASVVFQSYTANSLLVGVKDAGTGLPLSDATVRLTKTGYDESRLTGYGFTRQTDWSGGSGQVSYTNQTKYFSDSGTLNTASGNLKLKKVGCCYLNSGWLQSSTMDLGTQVNFNNIITIATIPWQTGANPITYQIASSNSSSPASWDFKGPDGSAGTYYTATNTLIWSGHDGNRYIRYKAFLNTANTGYTPTLSEVSFTYTTDCTPPGQAFFSGLSATTYTLDVSRAGYTTNNGTVDISGSSNVVVNLSPSS